MLPWGMAGKQVGSATPSCSARFAPCLHARRGTIFVPIIGPSSVRSARRQLPNREAHRHSYEPPPQLRRLNESQLRLTRRLDPATADLGLHLADALTAASASLRACRPINVRLKRLTRWQLVRFSGWACFLTAARFASSLAAAGAQGARDTTTLDGRNVSGTWVRHRDLPTCDFPQKTEKFAPERSGCRRGPIVRPCRRLPFTAVRFAATILLRAGGRDRLCRIRGVAGLRRDGTTDFTAHVAAFQLLRL
jgi:hypothetical protein